MTKRLTNERVVVVSQRSELWLAEPIRGLSHCFLGGFLLACEACPFAWHVVNNTVASRRVVNERVFAPAHVSMLTKPRGGHETLKQAIRRQNSFPLMLFYLTSFVIRYYSDLPRSFR